MPDLISECRDFALGGFAGAYVLGTLGFPMLLLRVQVSLIGVLKRLPGAFVSGQAIFLSMVLGAGRMGVCGIATMLGGYLL